MQPGRELRAWNSSGRSALDVWDADVARVLLRVVRQSVQALAHPESDPASVAAGVISAVRRTPGIADVWITGADRPARQARRSPGDPPSGTVVTAPVGHEETSRVVAVRLEPGADNTLNREAVQAVVGVLDSALRIAARGYPSASGWRAGGVDPATLAAQMHAVVDNASMVIVTVRPDGSEWSASAAFTKLLGYRRDPQPRSSLCEIVHPDDRAAAAQAFSRVRNGTGSAEPLDIRVRTADGRWRVMQTQLCDLSWHPDVNAVVGYATDVTSQRETTRRLDVEHARLSELVATMHAGILAEDEHGRVVLANAEFARMFEHPEPALALHGRDRAEVLRAIRSRFQEPDAAERQLDLLAEADAAVTNAEFPLADGRVFDLDFVPINRNGVRMGALWQFRDVTVRVRAQRALEGHNQALADVAESKSEFVGTVSHEMRTPLTSVASFTRMLAEVGELNPQQHDFLVVIERNVNRLLRLIDDLLTLVRFESRRHQLKLDRLDPADLLHTAVTEWRPRAARAGVNLVPDIETGPPIRADEGRLRQVVDNLVGNALKFTGAGGTVTVWGIPQPDGWRIEISDTGIGIPEADLPQLFHTFARASNAVERNVPGTGLGLAIARTIVELHGGGISATSAEGVGTTITVVLPTEPPRDQQSRTAAGTRGTVAPAQQGGTP